MRELPATRFARADDMEAVRDLLALMHREAPVGAWCEAAVREHLGAVMRDGCVVLSLAGDGSPVGTLGLSPQQFWWSQDWSLQERWVFVHPQHRRAPHARALLVAARDAAISLSIPLVAGVFSDRRADAKVRLFSRVLGQPIGATFLVRP